MSQIYTSTAQYLAQKKTDDGNIVYSKVTSTGRSSLSEQEAYFAALKIAIITAENNLKNNINISLTSASINVNN